MSKFKFVSAGHKANIEGARLLKGSTSMFIEEKFDGSRFGLELGEDGLWSAWSRNGIDRSQNIPYILHQLDLMDWPKGTVLDCEVIVMHEDRTKHWELSRSVMGTKDYNPVVQQAHLLIFDIQFLGKDDFKNESYLFRRNVIKRAFESKSMKMLQADTYVYHGQLAYPRAWAIKHIEELWTAIVELGHGEGVMIKTDKIANYGKDWTKVKKEATADAFILGATPGKGKYEGQIGALELAVHDASGTIWPIGKCSGMEDAIRLQMTDMALQGTLKGNVIEVKFNDVTKNKKLRHPRFIRWRHDKPAIACLLEQLDT